MTLQLAIRFSGAVLFLFAGFIWNTVMSGISMFRIRQGPGWIDGRDAIDRNITGAWGMVLPDLGFRVFPYVVPNVGLYMLYALALLTVIRFALDFKNGGKVLIRFICVEGVLLFMRGCTVMSTSMSNPYPGCYRCGSECPSTVAESIWMTISKFHFDCGDMMFSSHTVHYLVIAFLWMHYNSNIFINAAVWCYTIPGVTLLIAARVHYTSQVMVAIMLTGTAWMWYCNMVSRFEANPSTLAKANILERFFLWIEGVEYVAEVKGYDHSDQSLSTLDEVTEKPLLEAMEENNEELGEDQQ